MENTLSSHIPMWKLFLQRKFDEPTADQYYMAQIAKEVHCVLMKAENAKKLKTKDFILKFSRESNRLISKPAPRRIERPVEEEEWVDIGGSDEARLEEVKQKTMASKSAWFAICKIPDKVKFEGG